MCRCDMRCVRSIASFLWILVLAFSETGAWATDLKLSTIRIDLSDRQPSAPLTVTNAGPDTTLVQLRLMRWTQENGSDVLVPSQDLLANPPITEIVVGKPQ